MESLDLCIARAGPEAGGGGAREKCADEPVAAANAGAVTPLTGDRYVGANAARRWRSGHRPSRRCFVLLILSQRWTSNRITT